MGRRGREKATAFEESQRCCVTSRGREWNGSRMLEGAGHVRGGAGHVRSPSLRLSSYRSGFIIKCCWVTRLIIACDRRRRRRRRRRVRVPLQKERCFVGGELFFRRMLVLCHQEVIIIILIREEERRR